MKNTLLILTSVLFCAITFAQSVPQGINYQAVARDSNGDVLMNQALTIQFSVISDITTSAVSWQETHTVSTNNYGLYTAIIGQGISTSVGSSATFDVIDWGASNHLLKVEVDYGGGFVDMGTTAFMSVPYALSSGSTINSLWQDNGNHLSPDSTASQDIIIYGQTDISGSIAIDGNADIWGTTRMSVAGIGTTNPTETLDVDGNVRMRTGSSSGYIAVSDSVGVMNWTDPMTINTLQGIQGLAGNDGVDGSDGTNGTNGINGTDGVDGTNGTPGTNGTNGVDGQGGVTNAGTGISVTGAGTSVSPYVVSTVGCTYSVGDLVPALGGYIFYLDGSGCHGLVAKATDEAGFYQWSSTNFSTWAYASGIYGGAQNTKKSIAGAVANSSICPAASVCDNLASGGYTDWYLPSKDELDMMYVNLHLQGLGGFASGYYWSSTEDGSYDAWNQSFYFGGGEQYRYDKSGNFSFVRAVRAF